eukprot:jgi/Tetstr1/444046/TSEL_031985.t1
MDQDKTRLPHLVPWDKEVEKKNLLQCHLTCVKYNGSQPDDVYYFFDCFPHDSSNTITVMYKTIKKEIERRGEALDTVWFQLDNTCRENKNKHTHERVDQVFSKFSVWLDDHAEFTKAQLLHKLQHGPEFILRGVPDGTPAYLASCTLYHSKADPGKAFADMEKEIWKAADRYAGLQEELRVLTYNPITINTSTQRRKRRRGAQAATIAVEHSNEAEEGGHAVAIPLENEDTTRREFDARPGNLVVMDNTADNPDAYREEGLLGDWENKYLVAYVRYRYDVQALDGLPEDHTEVDELDVAMCEPWLSTPHGKPDIPLTFAIAAARQSRDPEPDSSWDAAKKMKWLPITTMPLSLFSLRFPNVRRTARQCQHDFRGTKLTAVTSMKGVSEIKDSRHKNLVVRRPLAKLRYTMQLQEEANRECGASLPLDGIRHMEITYELARLRAALNVHKLDVDNKRRWFNDHRFNADEKKCVLDMLTI